MDLLILFLPFILILLALGGLAGFLAGLLGVGGGIVLVPGIYAVLSFLSADLGFASETIMHVSVGTSLAVIVPTGAYSAWSHYKKGSVEPFFVKYMGVGIIFGVVAATFIASGLNERVLKIIFASALIVLAVIMMRGRNKFKSSSATAFPLFLSSFAGVVVGLISTLIGIGGATLSVPYMSLRGLQMHKAIGTASVMGVLISIPAAFGFMVIGAGQDGLPPFSFGYVNILAWCCIVPMSVLFVPFGVRASHRTSVEKLRTGFAIFMIVVALNMWRIILQGG